MAVTASREEAPRHPWLAAFDQAPQAEFGKLLAGYAKITPYERADAPDAARMLFRPLPPDDPVRRKLGPAILGWLEQRRHETPPSGRPRLQHWIAEICEALEIVAALDVADAAAELRRHFMRWNEWTARFVLSPARDAHSEYWRMLALTQPLLRQNPMAGDPAGLEPLWLDICRLAGDALPRRYLSIGLLGLRRLPPPPTGSEAPFVAGLAHWALAQNPTDAEFRAEWLALKPLYPRTPERWRELVARLLRASPFREAGLEAPAWWLVDADFRPLARPDYRPRGAAPRAPFREDGDAEIERFGEPWARVEPRLDMLLQRHRQFVNTTGEPHFFVRTIHSLGTALIRPGADMPQLRARKAQALAREGLEWQPYDRHLWALWRDSLVAEGALEAAELVGWEAIRRDPDHVEARNQLATLLAERLHRPDDAEALLRDTIAAFPQNAFACTQLAELLIATDRLAEAEAVIDAAFAARAIGEATYALRARLQSHRGLPQDAAATVRDGLARFPINSVLQDYQRILASGRPLLLRNPVQRRPALQSAPPPAVTPHDPALDDTLRYGRLRRLRARAEGGDPAARQAALDEARAILREEPAFAYAGVLAARFGADDADALGSFAVAFEQALAQGDRSRLEALAKQQPRLQALTLVGRAVLGDEAAAWLVEALLKEPPARHEARTVTLLRAGLQPILAAANDLPAPQAIQQNRDAVLRCVYDTNEAALGDRIAA